MSLHPRKALGAVIVALVAATVSSAAPAPAREAAVPHPPSATVLTARLTGGNHFDSEIDTTIPPGGTVTITSPTLPPTMKSAKLELTTDDEFFAKMTEVFVQLPSPGKRLMACLVGTTVFAAMDNLSALFDQMSTYKAEEDDIILLRVAYCLQMVAVFSEYAAVVPNQARQAGSTCGQAAAGIKEQITHVGGSYQLTSKGTPKAKSKYGHVKIRCKLVNGTTMKLQLKPRKKGQSLRSALGTNNLYLGIANPTTATGSAPVHVAFSTP